MGFGVSAALSGSGGRRLIPHFGLQLFKAYFEFHNPLMFTVWTQFPHVVGYFLVTIGFKLLLKGEYFAFKLLIR